MVAIREEQAILSLEHDHGSDEVDGLTVELDTLGVEMGFGIDR